METEVETCKIRVREKERGVRGEVDGCSVRWKEAEVEANVEREVELDSQTATKVEVDT